MRRGLLIMPERRDLVGVADGLGAEVDRARDGDAHAPETPPWRMDPRAVVLRRCSYGLHVASLSQAVCVAARRVANAPERDLSTHLEELLVALSDLDDLAREACPWIRASLMPREGR